MSLSISGSQYLNVNLLPLGAFLEIGDTPTNRFPFKNIKKTVFWSMFGSSLGICRARKTWLTDGSGLMPTL
jgi:hypothetical protein